MMFSRLKKGKPRSINLQKYFSNFGKIHEKNIVAVLIWQKSVKIGQDYISCKYLKSM